MINQTRQSFAQLAIGSNTDYTLLGAQKGIGTLAQTINLCANAKIV